MKILKLLLILLVILLLLLAGLLAYLHFADLNAQRERIAAFASDAIDRQVNLDGELNVDLWPDLYVNVEGVSIANAGWGSEPVMANVGQAMLRVALRSLWRGPLTIRDLQLRDVDLLMESNAEGVSNWDFGGEEPEPEPDEPTGGGPGVIVDRAVLANIRLRQRAGGEEQRYELTALQLSADGADQQLLQGTGQLLDLPLTIDGQFNTRQQFATTGALHYALTVALGETALILNGERAAPGAGGEEHFTLDAEVNEAQQLLDKLELPLKVDGPARTHMDMQLGEERIAGTIDTRLGELEWTTRLEGSVRELVLQSRLATLDQLGVILAVEGLPEQPLDVDATIAFDEKALQIKALALTSGDTRLEATGELAGTVGPSALQLKASGDLASTWMSDLADLPFEFSAALQLSEEGLHLDPLQAVLGDSDLAGRVTVPNGEGAAIEARFTSKRIDVEQIVAAPESAEEPAAPESAEEPAAAASSPPPAAPPVAEAQSAESRYLFSEDPLPLDALRDNAINASWEVGQLVTPLLTLNTLTLDVTLQDGKLDVQSDFSGADGGMGRNSLVVDTAGGQAAVKLENRLRELRVNLASGEVDSAEDIPPLSLTVDLSASGASARELAASSDGNALLTLGPGLLTNSLMERFSGDILAQLVSALNPFAKAQTHMAFECGVVDLKVEKGVASIDPLSLQTDKLQILAGGEVDLNDEKLNIEFNTKPRTGVGVSADMFVTPFVSLEGTLASPRVGLNETSTLLTAGAAMATGGLSILWKGVYDRATGTIDQCKEFGDKYSHPPVE